MQRKNSKLNLRKSACIDKFDEAKQKVISSMNDAIQVVDLLEVRVQKLIKLLQETVEKNQAYEQTLAAKKQEMVLLQQDHKLLQERYQSLKTAAALLGSKDDKKSAKYVINNLIKEVDDCLAILSP